MIHIVPTAGIVRLRALHQLQHVLRRGVRNHGEPKRPVARRAEQHRVGAGRRVGRGDKPLLLAIRLPLHTLRAESGLRRRGLGSGCPEHNQSEKCLEQSHE